MKLGKRKRKIVFFIKFLSQKNLIYILPMNKRKIINDPVHGFITIPSDLIYDIIQHPYFQRLRRIRQLGLTDFVYPGALHTRFHHALGAMHLMCVAIDTLRSKGHFISPAEAEAAQIAILLHDIGHSPLSHALEETILKDTPHESLSLLLMQQLNQHFEGKLSLAIQIFTGTYSRQFFNQLVSSQLDIDRLDYLQRDCFFTGVAEGAIGGDRILKMLDVDNEQLVIEEKGIYSIENFLTARRLMYWQVYLHKTTISTEKMIVQAIRRARDLTRKSVEVFASPALKFFMEKDILLSDFQKKNSSLKVIDAFTSLDDYDIWGALKMWVHHQDKILSGISLMILNRNLFKIILSDEKIPQEKIEEIKENVTKKFQLTTEELTYFFLKGSTENAAYQSKSEQILIKTKKRGILDIAEASDLPNIKALTKNVKKYYICWARNPK
jgi:uncharacterized protein